MVSRVVCNSVGKVVKTHYSKRVNPILVLSLTAVIYSTGLCQNGSITSGSGMAKSGSDSLSAIFEDIYGRFPNAVTSELNYQHYETRYDNSVYPSPTYVLNQGLANFTLGNRTSYQLSGSVQAYSHSYESQYYNLGGAVRPNNSWQLSGTADYYRYGSQFANSLGVDLSTIYLSGGRIDFTEDKLRQYYYLSNLLPDVGQAGFSFSPIFGRLLSGTDISKNYSVNLPVMLFYGLTDNIVASGNAYYSRISTGSSSTSSGTFSSFQNDAWELSGGLSLGFLFEDKSLVTVGANWYTNKISQDNLSTFTNGYSYESANESKQTFGNISLSWDLLSLDRSISIYDLRRSYYTGRFLHTSEVANRLKVAFLTKSNDVNSLLPSSTIVGKTIFSDSVAVGISDLIQLDLGGNLVQSSNSIQSSKWGRYATAQLTFHNLRFSGSELSDFDYFFGMITNPGDYSVTAGGQLSSDNTLLGNLIEPSSRFVIDARFGIIERIDADLAYSYSRWGGNFSSSSNVFSLTLRANILPSARLQFYVGRGDSEYPGGDRSLKSNTTNFQISLDALF